MSRIEELADGVFVLSDLEPVRNRSWRPAGASGFEPFNKYVFLSGERALLLDTGPRAHRDSLLASLEKLVGSRALTVMVSRSEPDSITNVGAVVDRYPDLRLVGIMKNLPLLGLVETEREPRQGLVADRVILERTMANYGFPQLTPLEPVIKTLSTIWLHDSRTNILFTSDFFSAELLDDETSSVIRRSTDGRPSPSTVRQNLLAKFDWLEHARTDGHRNSWDEVFARFHPAALAPGLGRIQFGEQLVADVLRDYRAATFDKTLA